MMMDSDRWEWAASLLPSSTTSTSSIKEEEKEKEEKASKKKAEKKKTTNLSRYETDMEQAFAMQQQQQQRGTTTSTSHSSSLQQRRLLTVDDIRLGMTGLEKAGDLARSGDLEQAMKLYELSLELLIRYLHSPDSATVDLDATTSTISSRGDTEYPCDRSSVETLVTMALSDAESVKATLKQKKGQTQNPSESTREKSSKSSIKTADESSSSFSWLKDLLSSVCKQTAPNNNTGKSASTGKNVTATTARSTTTTTKKPTPSGAATGLSGWTTTTRSKTKQIYSRPVTGNTANSTCTGVTSAISSRRQQRKGAGAQQQPHSPTTRLPAAATTTAALAANSELRQTILTDFLVPPYSLQETTWSDIAGLDHVKQSLQETAILPLVRPDLFTGLRRPQNILLYGPPGTGKTLLVRAVAHESGSSLFCCSASSLTSKWMGEAEKLAKTLFQVAAEAAPALIFLDEVDALLSSRKSDGGEHEASRRLKTEFMVQMEGIKSSSSSSRGEDSSHHVLVLACTNCPWDVDSAVLRRFPRRIHVPLPDAPARTAMLEKLLEKAGKHSVTKRQLTSLVKRLEGFSCSDISAIASEASFGPIRDLDMQDVRAIPASKVRPISMQDFDAAMKNATKSVTEAQLRRYQEWQQEQGVSSAA